LPFPPIPDTMPNSSPIPGPKILLMGGSGSGKTYSIRTLIQAGITPFCVFTEPGQEVLGDLPPEKLHWHYIPPASQSWDAMIDAAQKVNQYSFESLTKMTDSNRKQYNQFEQLLHVFHNFTCQRTGEKFGDVSEWPTSRALVVYSLSGLSIMAMNQMTGGKPVRDQKDWGVAQNMLEFLVQKLCMDVQCTMVMIAHPEREIDEVAGGMKIMTSTLGKKLAPKIPRFFSDVVMAQREGKTFTWSTAATSADLKARNLPIADGLPPTFVQIIEAWKKQGGTIG